MGGTEVARRRPGPEHCQLGAAIPAIPATPICPHLPPRSAARGHTPSWQQPPTPRVPRVSQTPVPRSINQPKCFGRAGLTP